jgi:hypothetical protein
MRAHGTAYKKQHMVGTVPGLDTLGRRCTCSLPHQHLSGLVVFKDRSGRRVTEWKTSRAGRYAPLLCHFVVKASLACALDGALSDPAGDKHRNR